MIGLICDKLKKQKNKTSAWVKLCPVTRPLFVPMHLTKRSGIDWGLGALTNWTPIYKAIGWITRDASFPKLIHSPDQGKVHTVRGEERRAKQVQKPARLKAEGSRAKRVPWLPSRGILWKKRDPKAYFFTSSSLHVKCLPNGRQRRSKVKVLDSSTKPVQRLHFF